MPLTCPDCETELPPNANYCFICGRSLHHRAQTCERCGQPWPKSSGHRIFWVLLIAGALIALAYYLLLNYLAVFEVLS